MSIAISTLVWETSEAKGGALLVLLALADHANDQGGSCFPSVDRISQKARQCERNVQYNLRKLEKMGEIQTVALGGGHRATSYQIAVQKLQGRKDCTGAAGCTSGVQRVAPQRRNGLHPNHHRTTRESSLKGKGSLGWKK
jgi:hypothetical protein